MSADRPEEPLARVTYLFAHPSRRTAGVGTDALARAAAPASVVPTAAVPVPGSASGSEPVPPPAAQRAQRVAIEALARRGMSVAEMRALLGRRGLDPQTVESEVERLSARRLLDDGALAETLVRTLHERKRLGRAAIVAELERREIEPAAVEAALETLHGDDELELATELARRRAVQLRGCDEDTLRRRLSGYLQRRGYSAGTAGAAIRLTLADLSGRGPALPSRRPRVE
ncbi:MAG: regulatory protein RecX [Microbacteriaceae bacterium]